MQETDTIDEAPIRTVNATGNILWRLPNGELHRLDGPAIEDANGGKAWYQNGRPHRVDGPAVENAGGVGIEEWYVEGLYHRVDGPAVKFADGTQYWYLNGKRHRTDGPAVIWGHDGSVEWFANGLRIGTP